MSAAQHEGQPAERVAAALAAAGRRLGRRVGLARAGWALLAAAVLAQTGLALGSALGAPLALALAPAGLALLLALALAPGRAAPPSLAAAVLDHRLDAGATLVAAEEALRGEHARFRAPLLGEADRALAGASLARLLPLRAPPGLLLAGAAAALLPALLAPSASAAPPAPARARSLLVIDAPGLAAGGAEVGDGEPIAIPPDGAVAIAPAAPGAAVSDVDPLAALPPEVARAIRERIAERAPPGAGPAPAGTGASSSPPRDDPLARALREGDAAAALNEVERLAASAGQGDRAAQARLEALAHQVAQAGAGAGPAVTPAAGVDGAGRPLAMQPGALRARRPWTLEQTCRMYFDGATR